MPDKLMLIINVPPTLQDNLVDWLLEKEENPGFTSSIVFGHSSQIKHYNLAEQVTGRQKRAEFRIIATEAVILRLLDSLRSQFKDTGSHYWLIPVQDEGRL